MWLLSILVLGLALLRFGLLDAECWVFNLYVGVFLVKLFLFGVLCGMLLCFCDLVACRVVVWFACVGGEDLFVLCLLMCIVGATLSVGRLMLLVRLLRLVVVLAY